MFRKAAGELVDTAHSARTCINNTLAASACASILQSQASNLGNVLCDDCDVLQSAEIAANIDPDDSCKHVWLQLLSLQPVNESNHAVLLEC